MTGAPVPAWCRRRRSWPRCARTRRTRRRVRVCRRGRTAQERRRRRRGHPRRATRVLSAGRRAARRRTRVCSLRSGVAEVPCVRAAARARSSITGDELLPRPGVSRAVRAYRRFSNSVVLRGLVAARRRRRPALRDPARQARPIIRDGARRRGAPTSCSSPAVLQRRPGGSRAAAAPPSSASCAFHGVSMRPSSPAGDRSHRRALRVPAARESRSRCLCRVRVLRRAHADPSRSAGGRARGRTASHARAARAQDRFGRSAAPTTYGWRVEDGHARCHSRLRARRSCLRRCARPAAVDRAARAQEGMPEGAEVEVLLYDDAPEVLA